jgi:hypothetical protein
MNRKSSVKNNLEKPVCQKCKEPMHLISTGSLVRTFSCCGKTVIVNRKDVDGGI